MIGPLHVDVFNQSKYMLNGVTMKVRMTRSKDSFVLMAKSDVTQSFKVDILSAKLFVRKIENHTKSLPSTLNKDCKVPYNAHVV